MIVELQDEHLSAMPEPEERVFTDIEVLIDLIRLSIEGKPLSTTELGMRWSWDGPSVTAALQHHVDVRNMNIYNKLLKEEGDGKVPEDKGA